MNWGGGRCLVNGSSRTGDSSLLHVTAMCGRSRTFAVNVARLGTDFIDKDQSELAGLLAIAPRKISSRRAKGGQDPNANLPLLSLAAGALPQSIHHDLRF